MIKEILNNISFKRIQFRITFLIWVIIIFSVLVYLFGTIPSQRSAALERMDNEAKDITNSLGQVTATAIISEDYSFAVDHTLSVLRQSQSLVYVVITKTDGFSLIHKKDGWKIDTLRGLWKPSDLKETRSVMQQNEYSDGQEVYCFSTPFAYSGINWGWIHIGLSLKKFNTDNDNTTKRSFLIALVCIFVGLVAAFIFTKKLITPIQLLNKATRKVAEGDLNVRTEISTGDELQSLGDSFNKMTEALQKSRNELLENHEFTNNIIRSLNDTLIVCNTDWRISKVNFVTTNLLGYSEEELIGADINIVFDAASADKFQKNFMSVRELGNSDYFYNDELNYLSKSDKKIPVLFSSSALLSNENDIIGYVIIALDITERKKAETALQEAHDKLERRVLERTKELENLNSTLRNEIQSRIAGEEKIKASLEEKKVLLKEIHHRVKNNLQVISSLLYLQSNKIKIKEYKDIFNESQNRVKTMALVHEKLYKSDNLADIEIADYIHSLVNSLMRSYDVNANRIRTEMNIDSISLVIDKAIPFGLIINELVTNSLKYAFIDRDDGILKIEILKLKNGMISLSIIDNGIGIPDEFDISRSTSLGLRLVQTLVDQLEGTIELNKENGTTFTIVFSTLPNDEYAKD